ncbi:MAG: hypothetical protein O7D86_05705 [Proteobacteria bacterium]|nr:hypothetical protein [Pseudomonadota bacterium]
MTNPSLAVKPRIQEHQGAITELDSGECMLIGERERIPVGEYQAIY